MKNLLCFFLVLALAGAAGPVLGADEEEKIYEMEEIVITASKAPKTQGNVTQKIDIISEDDFAAMVIGNGNIAEILSYSPGNFASVLSRNDANWGSSGGLPHKYKSYMLDGLPVDSFVDPQSLDQFAFERIEDQRGSASVLYPNYLFMDFAGNQSPLAGTTNFILKERVKQPRTNMAAYYGSYSTIGTRFFHQRAAGKLHVFFGGSHEDSDYTDYGTEDSWLNMIDDPEYEKTKMYLRGTYFISEVPDHKVSLYAHRTWHDGDTGRPNRDFDHAYTTVNASYVWPISEKLTAQAKIGYRDYDRTWESDNWPTDISLKRESGVDQEIIPADVSLSLAPDDSALLTVGADFQSASYKTWRESTQRDVGNDADASHFGIYLQGEQILGKFILRMGTRYNHTEHDIDLLNDAPPGRGSESWNKFLWSTGARYNHSNTLSIYTNTGNSFMAPSLKSVGGTIKLSDRGVAGKDGHLPNPDLDPESGISYDLGANFQATEDMSLGLRGYLTSIDDQIVQVVVSDDPSQSQDINAGQTKTFGLEVEARHRPANWWQWFANYTFTSTEIENDVDADQDGADVPFVPEHMANVGLSFSLPGDFTASVWLQAFGGIYDSTSKANRKKFDGYELVNARIEKLFVSKDGYQIRLYLEPYNLTNNEFEMPWQFQDPGFSANGGLAVAF